MSSFPPLRRSRLNIEHWLSSIFPIVLENDRIGSASSWHRNQFEQARSDDQKGPAETPAYDRNKCRQKFERSGLVRRRRLMDRAVEPDRGGHAQTEHGKAKSPQDDLGSPPSLAAFQTAHNLAFRHH